MGKRIANPALRRGLNGFVYWMHDILMVRHGLVKIYNRPAAKGRSPEEIVTHYAPFVFF